MKKEKSSTSHIAPKWDTALTDEKRQQVEKKYNEMLASNLMQLSNKIEAVDKTFRDCLVKKDKASLPQGDCNINNLGERLQARYDPYLPLNSDLIMQESSKTVSLVMIILYGCVGLKADIEKSIASPSQFYRDLKNALRFFRAEYQDDATMKSGNDVISYRNVISFRNVISPKKNMFPKDWPGHLKPNMYWAYMGEKRIYGPKTEELIGKLRNAHANQEKGGQASGGKAEDNVQATTGTTKPKAEPIRDQVFIGYSHKDDEQWLDDLQTHLKPYVRNGSVTAWSDKQIAPGSRWFQEIKEALDNAKVAALLVTPNFLASDFIHENELTPLLKEAEKGNVRIIWIPVRACAYKETPLKDYQAAIDPDKPMASIKKADRDKALVKICKEIKKAVSR